MQELAVLAGWAMIGSDDDGGTDGNGAARETAIDGTFVGTLSGTDAFVAVVAAPVVRGQDQREVSVYVSDGERLSEWFSGQSELRNTFVATADDGDAEARGRLTEDAAEGSVELPDGKTVRYNAKPAAGAAGLYDLTVSGHEIPRELTSGSDRTVGRPGRGLPGERMMGRPVWTMGFEPGLCSVAAPATCPVALRARMRRCRLPTGSPAATT